MNPRRIRPIAVKEFRQIVRDKRSLILLLIYPALLMVLFGYALNFDVKHVSLAVLDQDNSRASREFIQSLLHSEYFDLQGYLSRPQEVDEVLDQSQVQAVLVVPSDFGVRLADGQEAKVQVNLDGANSNSASAVVGYITAACQSFSGRILADLLLRSGRNSISLPIDYRPRVWYNPELRSARFLIPGLIAIILLIMTVVSTSLSIVREKERGTMEQIIVSPVRPIEIILGKTIPYVLISLIASVVILVTGWGLFGIAVRGNILLLYLGMFVFLMGGLGLGLLISTLTHSQQAAFMISALLTMLPTIILSGFIFPIRNMPFVIRLVSYIIPARYFLPILRGIIVKGVGFGALWQSYLFLFAFAVVVILLSTARLRRQMA